jgi:hypothetical protein
VTHPRDAELQVDALVHEQAGEGGGEAWLVARQGCGRPASSTVVRRRGGQRLGQLVAMGPPADHATGPGRTLELEDSTRS